MDLLSLKFTSSELMTISKEQFLYKMLFFIASME